MQNNHPQNCKGSGCCVQRIVRCLGQKHKLLPIDPIGQANLARAIQLLRFVTLGLESVQAASDMMDMQKQSRPSPQSERPGGQRKRIRGQRVSAVSGTSDKVE